MITVDHTKEWADHWQENDSMSRQQYVDILKKIKVRLQKLVDMKFRPYEEVRENWDHEIAMDILKLNALIEAYDGTPN